MKTAIVSIISTFILLIPMYSMAPATNTVLAADTNVATAYNTNTTLVNPFKSPAVVENKTTIKVHFGMNIWAHNEPVNKDMKWNTFTPGPSVIVDFLWGNLNGIQIGLSGGWLQMGNNGLSSVPVAFDWTLDIGYFYATIGGGVGFLFFTGDDTSYLGVYQPHFMIMPILNPGFGINAKILDWLGFDAGLIFYIPLFPGYLFSYAQINANIGLCLYY